MKNQYYYKRSGSRTLSQRHISTGKNTASAETVAFIATIGVMLAIVLFSVFVNGIH